MGKTVFVDKELHERLLGGGISDSDKPVNYHVLTRENRVVFVVEQDDTFTAHEMEWDTAAFVAASLRAHILVALKQAGNINPAKTLNDYEGGLFANWQAAWKEAT